MSRFVGDVSRLTVHEVGKTGPLCAIEAIASKHKMNIYSDELLSYLVRGEGWHRCEYCLGPHPTAQHSEEEE